MFIVSLFIANLVYHFPVTELCFQMVEILPKCCWHVAVFHFPLPLSGYIFFFAYLLLRRRMKNWTKTFQKMYWANKTIIRAAVFNKPSMWIIYIAVQNGKQLSQICTTLLVRKGEISYFDRGHSCVNERVGDATTQSAQQKRKSVFL